MAGSATLVHTIPHTAIRQGARRRSVGPASAQAAALNSGGDDRSHLVLRSVLICVLNAILIDVLSDGSSLRKLQWQSGMASSGMEQHPSNGWVVLPFETAQAFEGWLDTNHADQPGLWVKFAKKRRGIPSISLTEALEVTMCFGWVDSKMHAYGNDYYVLRYQPRRPRSTWSARNRDLAERLIAADRMRPSGLAAVNPAKAGGRWDAS